MPLSTEEKADYYDKSQQYQNNLLRQDYQLFKVIEYGGRWIPTLLEELSHDISNYNPSLKIWAIVCGNALEVSLRCNVSDCNEVNLLAGGVVVGSCEIIP